MECTFLVIGEPKGKGRPRVTMQGGYAKAYTPKDTLDYEHYVASCYSQNYKHMMFPIGTEIEATILIVQSIPKSTSKKQRALMLKGEIHPTKKPDIDNVLKSIFDGLNGVAYHDDTQIVRVECSKKYGDEPCVLVMMRGVEGYDFNGSQELA